MKGLTTLSPFSLSPARSFLRSGPIFSSTMARMSSFDIGGSPFGKRVTAPSESIALANPDSERPEQTHRTLAGRMSRGISSANFSSCRAISSRPSRKITMRHPAFTRPKQSLIRLAASVPASLLSTATQAPAAASRSSRNVANASREHRAWSEARKR